MDDHQAIQRLKHGDLAGLETLVKKYQLKAFRAVYLILGDRSLSEEVVQQAFIKVSERIDQFDEKYPFGPWFYRIVVNDALKVVRRQKRLISLDQQLDDQTAHLADCLIDPEPKPERIIELQENNQNLVKAIQSLPADRRAAVVMFYYLDMSMKEMAAKTDQPLSTIKWWLRDARQRLHKLLQAPARG